LGNVPKLGAEKADGPIAYSDWKFAMMMALRGAEIWDIFETKKPSAAEAAKGWEAKASKALTIIGLAVDTTQYQYISDAKDGVEAWEKLRKVYEKNSRENRIALMRKFYNAEHNASLPIQDYINPIIKVATRLRAIGVKVEDSTIIDVLIMNLDEKWSNIAASLCATMDDSKEVADVTGALIDEEGRRNPIDQDSMSRDASESVLYANGTGKFQPNITCYECGQKGHIARRCLKKKKGNWKKKEDEEKEETNSSANIARDDYAF